MSEIIRLPHSTWELYVFDYWHEFWARRIDRPITEHDAHWKITATVMAYSAEDRKRKIDEQDALERELAGGAG